jgi:hypothetical protein
MAKGNRPPTPHPPRTLTEVHEALVRTRPARQAPLAEWLAYHQRSAAWYSKIAEIDRGHHHEALSMAEHQRGLAEEIETQIAAQRSSSNEQQEGVDGGENRDDASADDVDAGS